MIENISLDYLKIFHCVAELKNITKASEALLISQPAITQTIKKLEEAFGFSLFIRNRRGVELTKDGEQIFKNTQDLALCLNNIDKYIKEQNDCESGEIIVGCGGSIARRVMVVPFKKFNLAHPNIKLKQYENTQEVMFDMLRAGKIDICISQFSKECGNGLQFTHLFDEKHIFVCSPKYYQTHTEKEYQFIVQAKGSYSRKLFDSLNFNNIIINNTGYNLALDFCKNGLGIALLPTYVVEEDIKSKKLIQVLSNLNLPVANYGFYRNPQVNSKIIDELVKFLQ